MSKNDYIARREALNRALWDAGSECGFQKAVDLISLILNDPEFMGKDVWGEQRLSRLFHKVADLDAYFDRAYTMDPEADYLQEQMDTRLRQIFGKQFTPFSERYPYINQQKYTRNGKPNW